MMTVALQGTAKAYRMLLSLRSTSCFNDSMSFFNRFSVRTLSSISLACLCCVCSSNCCLSRRALRIFAACASKSRIFSETCIRTSIKGRYAFLTSLLCTLVCSLFLALQLRGSVGYGPFRVPIFPAEAFRFSILASSARSMNQRTRGWSWLP